MGKRRYTDKERELAFAEYAVCGNWQAVSEKLNIPVATLKTWWKNKPPDDGFDDIRRENKIGVLEEAGAAIENGVRLINRRIGRALQKEQELDEWIEEIVSDDDRSAKSKQAAISKIEALQLHKLNEISTAVGTLYDKRALAKGESTENIRISVKLPKEVEKYAE